MGEALGRLGPVWVVPVTMWAEGTQLLYLVLFNFLPSLSCTVVGLPRLVCFVVWEGAGDRVIF